MTLARPNSFEGEILNVTASGSDTYDYFTDVPRSVNYRDSKAISRKGIQVILDSEMLAIDEPWIFAATLNSIVSNASTFEKKKVRAKAFGAPKWARTVVDLTCIVSGTITIAALFTFISDLSSSSPTFEATSFSAFFLFLIVSVSAFLAKRELDQVL